MSPPDFIFLFFYVYYMRIPQSCWDIRVIKNTINGLSVLKGFINVRLTQQLVGQDLQASLHGIMWSGSSSTVLMVLYRTKDREGVNHNLIIMPLHS